MPIENYITGNEKIQIKETIERKKLVLECDDKTEYYCPYCGSYHLRCKDTFIKNIKGIKLGARATILRFKAHKYKCLDCGHYFSKKGGYATTLVNLSKHKVFDVVLGRSEQNLIGYLSRLKGKDKVRVVVMDLSSNYRSIAKKYFPNAMIVSDRFHVIKLIKGTKGPKNNVVQEKPVGHCLIIPILFFKFIISSNSILKLRPPK